MATPLPLGLSLGLYSIPIHEVVRYVACLKPRTIERGKSQERRCNVCDDKHKHNQAVKSQRSAADRGCKFPKSTVISPLVLSRVGGVVSVSVSNAIGVVGILGQNLPMSERLMNLLAELEYQRRPYVTVRLREIFKESGSPSRVDFDLRLFRRGHKAYS